MRKTPVLSTWHLRITPRTEAELCEKLEIAADAEERKRYCEMLAGVRYDPQHWLWYTNWAIALRSNGTEVGEFSFKGPVNHRGEVEIGCMIRPEHRRKGYATEAVREMLRWAFRDEHVYFIMAETTPENVPSQKLLRKLGFSKTGKYGEEGPVFELEREPAVNRNRMMSLGVLFGISAGLLLLQNVQEGVVIGLLAGWLMGSFADAKDRRNRENLRQIRR